MKVVAWFLFVLFFVPVFAGFTNWLNTKANITLKAHLVWMLTCVILAVCAGIIWGGLRLW